MKSVLFILCLIFSSASAQKPFALVELFTSEGCSSCPPADELLSEIKSDAEKKGENIITLAYHVDYWNKYGWMDPFSKFQYTIRQENYSRVLPGGEVYTPQAIVNGQSECIGSKKEQLRSFIQDALAMQSKVNLTLAIDSSKNDTMYFSYVISATNNDYVLRFAQAEDSLTSHVGKGENSGKTLHHDSVVRHFTSVDMPLKKGTIELSRKAYSGNGKKYVVAFIQSKKTKHVLAATKIYLK